MIGEDCGNTRSPYRRGSGGIGSQRANDGRAIVDQHKSMTKRGKYIQKNQEKCSQHSLPSFWG